MVAGAKARGMHRAKFYVSFYLFFFFLTFARSKLTVFFIPKRCANIYFKAFSNSCISCCSIIFYKVALKNVCVCVCVCWEKWKYKHVD